MTAQILQFPAASPLQRSVAGCMGACWATRSGAPVDVEAVGRLHRHVSARRPAVRDAARLLRQLQAATGWLEDAHLAAVVAASADGESAGEDADDAASRACDIAGALGLLAMCRDALQPAFTRMSDLEITGAWTGLQMDVG